MYWTMGRLRDIALKIRSMPPKALSFISTVTYTPEKRGIIGSVSELRELKELRNEIVHEYETEDISKFFHWF
ncbi:hypothetical protein [Leadbettera azotonutricia]|uniref:hypothetical protein n=1 Tax=Leadbettera azotonutricia TaxID=150829 RepID=UPI0015776CE2|nr:hypothetical protein [Leadbettera azotonutricia]